MWAKGGDNMSDHFPANEVEALAYLYVQDYANGRPLKPENLYEKYKEAYDKISQCRQQDQANQTVKGE